MCLSADLSRYRLSPDTVARVREYAKANGYVPNRLARKLSRSDSSAVGLIVLYESSSEKSTRALETTMERLTAEGREFFIQNVPCDKLSDALLFLKGMRVRDIILFGLMREYPPSAGKLSPNNERLGKVRGIAEGNASFLRRLLLSRPERYAVPGKYLPHGNRPPENITEPVR